MADQGKINPPPKPTTPKAAPWDDVESILTRLDQLIATENAYTAAIVQLLASLSGNTISLNVPVTAGAPVQTGNTAYVDSGISTGGTNTTLQDTSKSWQVGSLQGAFIFVVVGSQEYQSTITSNKNNELTFVAMAISVTSGAAYSIRQPVFGNKGSFITGGAIIATAGVPVQLPDIPIPAGSAAFLMAYPGNGGNIFFANSQANVLKTSPDPTTGNMRFQYLAIGDSIPLHESNLNAYWVDTDNSGDSVVWKI